MNRISYRIFCYIDNHPFPHALPVITAHSTSGARIKATHEAARLKLPLSALTYEVWRLKESS